MLKMKTTFLILLSCFISFSSNQYQPIVITTWEFKIASEAAWKLIQNPEHNALDAIVAGCSACEAKQCDGTVGFGGSPDEHAETTLDAMLMDGATMNVGAVAAMRDIKQASAVARHVLENTEHTLLVGDRATDFAVMMGFKKESLTTPHSKEMWEKWKENECQPNFWINVLPDPKVSCGPYEPLTANDVNYDERLNVFNSKNHDTIGMVAIDLKGNIAAGTSSNGAKFKIPGRVGDSPITGAGGYADNEVGAAAATGDGDIMMRFLPSFLAVEYLRSGSPPDEAAHRALHRIKKFHPNYYGAVIVLKKNGEYGVACNGMDEFPFYVAKNDSGVERHTIICL